MADAGERYDSIGTTYSATRREDPRIAARLHAALGHGRTLVNIGAGTGNYEPDGWDVVAVEPSSEMLAQRRAAAAPAVRGVAGFGAAFWARPDAYLDPTVQAGMSWLALLTDSQRAAGARRLRTDLESGEWDRRFGHLRTQASFDAGYRVAIAGRST